mmetsp:Transcript_23414/g.65139  ORF Transcript_23414/g.65139 Transcript_23414/m.65139 type:complete len:211 (+) Transcript_23414:1150-1782(+)
MECRPWTNPPPLSLLVPTKLPPPTPTLWLPGWNPTGNNDSKPCCHSFLVASFPWPFASACFCWPRGKFWSKPWSFCSSKPSAARTHSWASPSFGRWPLKSPSFNNHRGSFDTGAVLPCCSYPAPRTWCGCWDTVPFLTVTWRGCCCWNPCTASRTPAPNWPPWIGPPPMRRRDGKPRDKASSRCGKGWDPLSVWCTVVGPKNSGEDVDCI